MPQAQHRLWLADQLAPSGIAYLSSVFLRLRGPLDVAALDRALTGIVTRHEVLRTSVSAREGEVTGILRPPTVFRLAVRPVDPADLEGAVRTEAVTPLDVTGGPPFRATLMQLAPDDHVLSLTVHHLACDWGSMGILYRELSSAYRSIAVPQAVRQYRDIALQEDARLGGGELALPLAERHAALAGLGPFELPTDLPRPAVRDGAGELCHAFGVGPETVRRLTEVGRAHHATLYMVLLAACQTLLYRYSGRADLVTGTSSSTRRGSESESVIGPFFNMLAIPGDLSGNPSFAELVRRVRDQALDAYDARWIPLDTLATELKVERDPARTPLFQILVDLTTPLEPPELPGLQVSELLTPGAGSKYDLTIEFRRRDGGLGLSLEWDTALYERATITRLIAHLRAVLESVAEDPSLHLDDVPMLSPAETLELRALAEPEGGPVAPPAGCLHELFTAQAARTPDAVAVLDGETVWTYRELDERSTAIANGLAVLGVGADAPVGVLLDRSAGLVAAVLGVLKAGGAYLPIDPESPPYRKAELLAAAGAGVCVVPPGGTEPRMAGTRLVTIEELAGADAPVAKATVSPDHLCAVYFTSGSTGVPKGVACTHRGWVGQMENMQRCYGLAPGESLLFKTPLSFDDVAREIFWPLMLGGRVVVLPPGLHRDPRAVLAAAIEHRVVWLQFVPDMLALFLDAVAPGDLDRLRHLRHVVSDGDRLRPETVHRFFESLGSTRPGTPGSRLHNHWGTTEVSIDTTHHICTRADAEGEEAVRLGRPMEHNCVYVLDAAFQPVPLGAIGELFIGGAGLARGYLGDPGRTARSFVPHPWRPGERLYRTGDTGRLRPDGSLQYRGRRDHQVKIRGVRIELGEVEAAVRGFPGVTDAVVATWEPVAGDRRLVAYATHADCDSPSVRDRLRDFLTERLAPSAVPNAIVLLPELPRNPSGKIDRRSLPRPDPDAAAATEFEAPASDTEEVLAEIWAAVLAVTRLGATDDFFAAGGHSLLVIRALNRMREAFDIDLPVRFLFEHSTVRSAAAQLEKLIIAEIEAMSDERARSLIAAEPEEAIDVRIR